jgi:putative DNA primase/helicase
MLDVAAFARAYIDKYHLAIVQIEPGRKFPTHEGWNKPGGWFADSGAAIAFYERHPAWGMGAVLAPSGLCSLDVDNVLESRSVLGEFGIDVDKLAQQYPTIVGRPDHCRVLFAVPPSAALGRKALIWPNSSDPAKRHVLFELRGGDVQDVLPPTIHPDTRKPYIWHTRPNGCFPEMPEEMAAIWRNWQIFKPQAQALCPWAPKKPAPQCGPRNASRTGASVIDEFVRANPIDATLERYGYRQRGKRWLSPHSTTGLPGVSRLDDQRVFMHHASDPLSCEHPLNSFDFWCWYEHDGDVRRAVKAAAALLGLTQR